LVAALIAAPFCGVTFLCVGLPHLLVWWNHVPFDSAAWKATTHPGPRYDMSWELVHGNVLLGKTGPEVEALLGKPGEKDVFGDVPMMPKFSTPHFKRGVETWYYDLGAEKYESGLGAVLAVDFWGGKVFDVRKVVH
jgi:hypothetical protein